MVNSVLVWVDQLVTAGEWQEIVVRVFRARFLRADTL